MTEQHPIEADHRDERAPAAADQPTIQAVLPSLRPILRARRWAGTGPACDDEFAHPAERDFSQILSFYRIRWTYEPTTFALAWNDDGRPAEMFTPDFYLPDQRLYIELTTMRQRLVTRKNRKLRRLRELYPNVQIKLLYRRDYHRLLDAYRGSRRTPPCQLGRVIFDEATIRARIAELAASIAADWDSGPTDDRPLILGVGRGSATFLTALTGALTAHRAAFDTDRIILTRYRTPGGGQRVRVRHGPATPVAGRRVLIVEDVVSTGLSLAYLSRWLQRRRAAAVSVCTLLDRTAARLVGVPVPYAGFEAPDELLVGFGLHLRRQFRDLPYIATIAKP